MEGGSNGSQHCRKLAGAQIGQSFEWDSGNGQQDEPNVAAAAHQAFWLLRITFTVAPILFGVDKFFNWSVHWPDYLADWINNIVPGSGQDFMYVVGGIEIVAGLLVAVAPRIGAFVVAGWLFGIVLNLLTKTHRSTTTSPCATSA